MMMNFRLWVPVHRVEVRKNPLLYAGMSASDTPTKRLTVN
jgi:hypothetical protein